MGYVKHLGKLKDFIFKSYNIVLEFLMVGSWKTVFGINLAELINKGAGGKYTINLYAGNQVFHIEEQYNSFKSRKFM